MANESADVLVGTPLSTGGFLSGASADVALPTDGTTALTAADWINHGYLSEDGVTRTVDASDEKIKAWGGDTVRLVRTDHAVTYAGTILQYATVENLKLIFGDANVTESGGNITVKITNYLAAPRPYLFLVNDAPHAIREVIPKGQLSYSGDTTFVQGQAITLAFTIEALPDADGVKAYEYLSTAAAPVQPAA